MNWERNRLWVPWSRGGLRTGGDAGYQEGSGVPWVRRCRGGQQRRRGCYRCGGFDHVVRDCFQFRWPASSGTRTESGGNGRKGYDDKAEVNLAEAGKAVPEVAGG